LALNHEQDPDKSVILAAHSLLALRGVTPAWGVPLAIDTVDRSALAILGDEDRRRCLSPRACFHLAMAAGAFHRDYGDYERARMYFSLAQSFSRLCGEYHVYTDEFMRLVSHYRVLLIGLGLDQSAALLRDHLRLHSSFFSTPPGQTNELLWTLKPIAGRTNPEEVLEQLGLLEQTVLVGGSLRDSPPRTIRNSGLTAWTHAGYLSVIAEVDARMRRDKQSLDAIATAAMLLKKHKISPSAVAQLPILRAVASKSGDPAFAFHFRSRGDLLRQYRRTSAFRLLSFQQASYELRCWLFEIAQSRRQEVIGTSRGMISLERTP
jgi:hypothetical protein